MDEQVTEVAPARKSHPIRRMLFRLALLGGGANLLYRKVVRPWHIRWGATDEEVDAWMEGDDVLPRPPYNTTHAVTIDAQPDKVWPWLVQMGAGRGGMYTYDWMENLAKLGMHSADRILPEYQHLEPGDMVPFDAASGFGMAVKQIEPKRLLLLQGVDDNMACTWAWKLAPLEAGRTRLVTRWRADFKFSASFNERTLEDLKKDPFKTAMMLMITRFIEPGEFIMERGMMLGIKRRAEMLAREGDSATLDTAPVVPPDKIEPEPVRELVTV